MELPEEFKAVIEERYPYKGKTRWTDTGASKPITNPSAFTSIFYHMGFSGMKFMEVRKFVEKEMQRLNNEGNKK